MAAHYVTTQAYGSIHFEYQWMPSAMQHSWPIALLTYSFQCFSPNFALCLSDVLCRSLSTFSSAADSMQPVSNVITPMFCNNYPQNQSKNTNSYLSKHCVTTAKDCSTCLWPLLGRNPSFSRRLPPHKWRNMQLALCNQNIAWGLYCDLCILIVRPKTMKYSMHYYFIIAQKFMVILHA